MGGQTEALLKEDGPEADEMRKRSSIAYVFVRVSSLVLHPSCAADGGLV